MNCCIIMDHAGCANITASFFNITAIDFLMSSFNMYVNYFNYCTYYIVSHYKVLPHIS